MNTTNITIIILLISCLCSLLITASSIFAGYYYYNIIIEYLKKYIGQYIPCFNCTDDQYCDILECKNKIQPGDSCLFDGQCQYGKCIPGALKCADESGNLPLGTYCIVGQGQCGDDAWCGGVPVQCREKGGDGAYCPLDSSACQDGYYCGADSKCHALGHGGDPCLYNSHCQSGKCSYDTTLAYNICKWDISGMETYNSLDPPGTGTCIGPSGAVTHIYETKKKGKGICEQTPNFQFSGETSDNFDWAPGSPGGTCRKDTSVPVCVKVP